MLLPTVETLINRFRLAVGNFKLQEPRRDISRSEYAAELTQFFVHQVLAAIGANWNQILEPSYLHMGALEDRVCVNPVDEFHTGVLWKNATQWAKMKQLVNSHITCVLRLDCTFSEIMLWTKRNWRAWPCLH